MQKGSFTHPLLNDEHISTLNMKQIIVKHAALGSIKALHDPSNSVIKILGLPYGTISHRFSRSTLVPNLSSTNSSRYKNSVFDATRPGASSIQPWGSVTSDASNIPLPTDDLPDDEEQSENCLNLSIHLPSSLIEDNGVLRGHEKLPVLVFIHGGAFFLGSANRPYYDPSSLVTHAMQRHTPIIFVGINYRLGILGFLHSPDANNLLPANNGLYDQDVAFEWVREHISGFGGDVENVTMLGQSAGGESVSLRTMQTGLARRAIALSGTPVTMPAMSAGEHAGNVLSQAKKAGIKILDGDGKERKAGDVARDLIDVDVSKIRDLAWVGLPCSNTPFMPVDRPSMARMRDGSWPVPPGSKSVEALIVGTTTYDGGISYNMMSKDSSRTQHAKAFISIATDVLGHIHADTLCSIYGILADQKDPDALQRICLFESDIGFFAAALSIAEGGLVHNTYFQIFDLPNPFDGPLKRQGDFATHTFDIVTLLGGVHEDRLPQGHRESVALWRDRILDFAVSGNPPCKRFGGEGNALVVDGEGVREVGKEAYLGSDERRRERLFGLAEQIKGRYGRDVLWVDVCRRFLMKGE